jgi:molecular chaperone GrpE (heat shock protein)
MVEGMEEVRQRAAEVLRAASRAHREAERALDACTSDLSQMALAAVEGLEALSEAVVAVQGDLPESVRAVLDLSARAAWERLEAAGIRLDGRVGEPVDLARHRVVKTVAGRAPGTVASVVTPGVILHGRRLRDAVVCVVEDGAAG